MSRQPFGRPTVEEAISRCECGCHVIGSSNVMHCVACCPIENSKYKYESGKLDEEGYKKILRRYRDETKVYKSLGD